MSRPLLYWATRTFFYPLGNTPAVCLTRDLSSEQPADILLLGCGDPRNILFTLYADLVTSPELRKFDITCCDVEPAVLARNALLFSLLEDRENIDRIWDIFYHFKIDDVTLQLLTRQSRRLHELSKDIETWRQSSYGSFLSFVDTQTLSNMRRHWKDYSEFSNLPAVRLDKLRLDQIRGSKATLDKYVQKELGPSRSAGMLWMEAYEPMSDAYVHYWKTGTTSSLAADIANAKHLNPTFVYSISGESFVPDRGTFPQGFHLMPAFVPIASNPMAPRESSAGGSPIDISKQQFKAWCDAFCASRAAGRIIIRFYSGDALAFCRALDLYALTGCAAPGLFVSPWHGARINLEDLPTRVPPALTSFDVIDTSNLSDHLGLLNLLLAAQPLLKANPISQAVLYTEQMTIQRAGNTIARPFVERMFATIPTVSALLGIAPLAYISGFTTHSNVHEILANASQSLERITWVDPTNDDLHTSSHRTSVQCDPDDLAYILLSAYNNILPHDQGMSSRVNSHYHQETIAALCLLVKRRVRVKTGTWDDAVAKFLELVASDQKRPLARETYQDLCLQLHLYGVYTQEALKPDWFTRLAIESPSQVVENWSSTPPILCVVLTVPRQYIRILSSDDMPMLQCKLTTRGSNSSTFSVIHAVWGKLVSAAGSDSVTLEEDSRGFGGESNLVVSFWSPSHILQDESTSVALTLIPNSHSAGFSDVLGPQLDIFGAKLSDKQHVRLLPYRPASPSTCSSSSQYPAIPSPDFDPSSGCFSSSIGISNKDGICCVSSFSSQVGIDTPNEQKLLLDGANPTVVQISPCTIRLSISSYHHIIPYPYPIFGSRHKLRVARKSHYIEVVVPVSEYLDSSGYSMNYCPVLRKNALSPWNVHSINVDRMPLLGIDDPTKLMWLNMLTALQLSDRERATISNTRAAESSILTTFMGIKDTIHSLVNNSAGAWGTKVQVFALCEPSEPEEVYALLLVGGVRLDLASSTIVVDTAVLPLAGSTWPEMAAAAERLQAETTIASLRPLGGEAVVWKHLLPAFVERARTWSHRVNCEYTRHGKIPLSIGPGESPICRYITLVLYPTRREHGGSKTGTGSWSIGDARNETAESLADGERVLGLWWSGEAESTGL